MINEKTGEVFDLIVIGGGPGGYEAALEASKVHGMKVALVEADELGGICLNRGCIPTKTLLHSAGLFHQTKKKGNVLGLEGTDLLELNLESLQNHKDDVVEQLRNGVNSLMKAGKVTVIKGRGSVISENSVLISDYEGIETLAEGKNILIATGSVPSVPPIDGSKLEGVMTSDEILDWKKPIESLLIIGGGVIGCEIGSLFNCLGTKVTIVEALDRLLPTMDRELGQSIKMQFKKDGIDVHTKASVKKIEKDSKGLICHLEDMNIPCEKILIATGRKPNTQGLIASNANEKIKNLSMERGKIIVNESFETNVKGIYAIGDVIGGIQLAHVATAEGRCAVAAMNGKQMPVDLSIIPSCVYTEPEISSVGMSQEEATEKNIKTGTRKYSMGANGKSVLELSERGFIKVIYQQDTEKILGAVMLCSRATDMISQFSQAIENGLTLNDLSKFIYPHPTFCEALGEVAK